MEIKTTGQEISSVSEEALVVPVFEFETPRDGILGSLDALTHGAIADAFDRGEFDGSADQVLFLHRSGDLSARRLLLYGAGNRDKVTPARLGEVAGAAARSVLSRGLKAVGFLARGSGGSAELVQRIVEGVIIGQLSSTLYSQYSQSDNPQLNSLTVVCEGAIPDGLESALEAGRILGEATNLARELGNEPSNIMTPSEMARRTQEMAERLGLKSEILDEAELERRGFGALLGVSRGSSEPPRFIILEYCVDDSLEYCVHESAGRHGTGANQVGPQDQEVIALVGKAVTFDSGGISIKPAASMDEMKFDMCGGAAVIGAMQAIARLKPSARVLGLVPACENMPSGRSYKPGDVLTGLGGKTIEIINTDAEGRLILSDAITYAVNRGASTIVDAATLTGACVVALGEIRAAVMGTDQRLIDQLIQAGERAGERIWQLPIDDRYGEQIRSPIADIKNDGGRGAGAITAGMFLKAFAGETPWAHLDIAGTAWINEPKPFMAKGATGFGVRTFVNFVLERAGQWTASGADCDR
jgi:leucyl aminopeptidase